jgi:F0F1-type ATP synthase assembly protein I
MAEPTPQGGSPASKSKTSQHSILRFAGMGFQLAVAIGLGVMAGLKLDEWLGWEQPLGTAVMALVGLAAGMYQVLKALR